MKSIKHIIASLFPRRFSLLVKYVYQRAHMLIHGKRPLATGNCIECRHKKDMHTFFGYYDISPFNPESDEIVYIQLPKELEFANIIISSVGDKGERVLTKTYAWNWQQGCRLRWMPNNSREIAFNDFIDGNYLTRIIDVDSRQEKRINAALYDISPDGKLGLSIDFERLQNKRPGYGYQCGKYKEDKSSLFGEGIDLVDIDQDTKKRIITYGDIAKLDGCESDDFSKNYINHLSFSPSGNRFLFFWLSVDGCVHNARLLVCDIRTIEVFVVETEKRVSHYVWENDDQILYTAYDKDQSCHYYQYSLTTRNRTLLTEVLNEDGHPSVLSTHSILTDTYPNLLGFQRILIYDSIIDKKKTILEIYSDCRVEGERRTDLHPRVNFKNRIVCFDSNQNRYRSLNFMRLGNEE